MIGLLAVTLGLIAIDKHASGVLPSTVQMPAPTFPMMVCSRPQGHWACFSWMVWPETISLPAKPACWEPSLWPTAAFSTSCGSVVAESGSASGGRDQASRPVCRGMERMLGLIHSSAAFGPRNWGWLEGGSALEEFPTSYLGV